MTLRKVIPILLLAHYQGRCTTVAPFIHLTLRDGREFFFTGTDRPVTIAGDVYVPGFGLSAIQSTEGLAIDNLELSLVAGDSMLNSELVAGAWQGAWCILFNANYLDPSQGIDILKMGSLGECRRVGETAYVVEVLGLAHAINQSQALISSIECRARFADFPRQRPYARCGLDAEANTVSGTLTAVASAQTVTDSARAEPDDWFGEGLFWFTDGPNKPFMRKVRVFESGEFTFDMGFPFDIEVGHPYQVIAGCRKRLEEDCRDKHDNVLNHQGERYKPGNSKDIAVDVPEEDGGAE